MTTENDVREEVISRVSQGHHSEFLLDGDFDTDVDDLYDAVSGEFDARSESFSYKDFNRAFRAAVIEAYAKCDRTIHTDANTGEETVGLPLEQLTVEQALDNLLPQQNEEAK
jgi:hypothetical protein